jgi:hypothetical protein
MLVIDEPELRNVVILDPIAYFVTPVTVIICKHVPTANDPTHHVLDVHKTCMKKKLRQWQRMISNGIADNELLLMLLEAYSENSPALVRLMMKFGLLVHLQCCHSTSVEYLVPALLPLSASNDSWSDVEWSTCYLTFSASEDFQRFPTITESETAMFGFLPSGLFERLIGKAIVWAQNTSSSQTYTNFLLNHDEAILYFGSRRFRLKVRYDLCAIELNVEGRNVKAVHQRVLEQVGAIMGECMRSLYCFTSLQYPYSTFNASTPTFAFRDETFLIPLHQIKSIVQSHSVLNRPGGRRLLTSAEASAMYQDWLPNADTREKYDVFISYRWGPSDSLFVQSVFDRFGLFTVGDTAREVDVFLDRECLQSGQLFQTEFAGALKNALVVCPIVSSDALLRMCGGEASIEDNVIVEVFSMNNELFIF